MRPFWSFRKPDMSFLNTTAGLMGLFVVLFLSASPAFATNTVNNLVGNITYEIRTVPGVLSGTAYMFGILLGFLGILNLKDHVIRPNEVPLRNGLVKLIIGGAFLSLPFMLEVARQTIIGDSDQVFGATTAVGPGGTLVGQNITCTPTGGEGGYVCVNYGPIVTGGCLPIDGGGGGGGLTTNTLGSLVCNILQTTDYIPFLFSAFSYIAGIVMVMWGLAKVKAHVEDPTRVNVMEAIVRFLAGGAFLGLPAFISFIHDTIFNPLVYTGPLGNLAYDDGNALGNGLSPAGLSGGVDTMVVNFVSSIFEPLDYLIGGFGYVAGIVFMLIGISRLLKGYQDGPRGPAGIGTIMTFGIGALLLGFGNIMGTLNATIFYPLWGPLGAVTEMDPILGANLSAGMTPEAITSTTEIIQAALAFMMIVGWISFMRGLFLFRAAAEGNQQASLMSAMTHIIAGSLAANLGGFLNAVQTTLGIATVDGINF